MIEINPSEITPKALFLSRRKFITGLGAALAGTAFLSACQGGGGLPSLPAADEPGDNPTPYGSVISYNNYYEFTTSKEGVAELAQNFKVSPWTVAVGGLVAHPRTYRIDDLLKRFPPEERIYRLRCVEAWSMVIPWLVYPAALLAVTHFFWQVKADFREPLVYGAAVILWLAVRLAGLRIPPERRR
ncbi:MAG: molybdopterin-dependent oxidoreductase [Chloroflexota bacterium]